MEIIVIATAMHCNIYPYVQCGYLDFFFMEDRSEGVSSSISDVTLL